MSDEVWLKGFAEKNPLADEMIRRDERRNLLVWLAEKDYLCQVSVYEDEDSEGYRIYKTVERYPSVDEILEEYETEQLKE